MRPTDRFCGACGHEVGEPAVGPPRRRDRSAERATRAVGVVFVGIVIAIAVLSFAPVDDATAQIALYCAEIGVGLVAVVFLGPRAWRAALGGLTAAPWIALAIGVGAATATVSFAYVQLLLALLGLTPDPESLGLFRLASMIVLAPLIEEWLCRGVVWHALAPFTGPRERNVAAAVLFGLLHCAGGLHNFPHRFVSGLAFGWLRERSGSLIPPIAAHATHNLLAVLVA